MMNSPSPQRSPGSAGGSDPGGALDEDTRKIMALLTRANSPDLHDRLGVPPNASLRTIDRAILAFARIHPSNASSREEEAIFKDAYAKVMEAHNTLRTNSGSTGGATPGTSAPLPPTPKVDPTTATLAPTSAPAPTSAASGVVVLNGGKIVNPSTSTPTLALTPTTSPIKTVDEDKLAGRPRGPLGLLWDVFNNERFLKFTAIVGAPALGVAAGLGVTAIAGTYLSALAPVAMGVMAGAWVAYGVSKFVADYRLPFALKRKFHSPILASVELWGEPGQMAFYIGKALDRLCDSLGTQKRPDGTYINLKEVAAVTRDLSAKHSKINQDLADILRTQGVEAHEQAQKQKSAEDAQYYKTFTEMLNDLPDMYFDVLRPFDRTETSKLSLNVKTLGKAYWELRHYEADWGGLDPNSRNNILSRVMTDVNQMLRTTQNDDKLNPALADKMMQFKYFPYLTLENLYMITAKISVAGYLGTLFWPNVSKFF